MFGALEVVHGSVVHGAARMVKGMVRAMILAVLVAFGWQLFGHDLKARGQRGAGSW